jgi:hypothetical protein
MILGIHYAVQQRCTSARRRPSDMEMKMSDTLKIFVLVTQTLMNACNSSHKSVNNEKSSSSDSPDFEQFQPSSPSPLVKFRSAGFKDDMERGK